jgi:hypothetical protein
MILFIYFILWMFSTIIFYDIVELFLSFINQKSMALLSFTVILTQRCCDSVCLVDNV